VDEKGVYVSRMAKGCPVLPPFKAGEGLFGEAALSPQIVKIADIKEASQAEKGLLLPFNIKVLLLVPMETKGKKIGLLFIGVEKEYTPSNIELNLISTIADQMTIAIENASVYEKEKEAVKRLIDIDNMKTELISMVSHELRTPITSIKGFLFHFISGTTGPVNETQMKFLKIMSKEGDQLLSLVDNLLEFSRIEREGPKYRKEPLKIDALIREVADALQPQLESKNAALTLHLSAGEASFLGDDMKIGQVIKNLIGNAIKFTRESARIDILSAVLPDGKIEVRVKDNGMGMNSEQLNKIFQKFYQADSSLTRKIGGLGLGLAISKEIIEAHGGRITAASEGIDKGSSFIFTLPMIK
jgi:signal transduction histidine kinase